MADDPTTDAALRTLLSDYESAFNANDARAMNALFADDCVFVSFGGALVRGRAPLYDAQAAVFDPGGALTSISVRYEPEQVTVLSPSLAVVHARQRTVDDVGRPIGRPDPMEAVLAVTAQRSDGTWRIRLGQNTPVVSPPAEDPPISR